MAMTLLEKAQQVLEEKRTKAQATKCQSLSNYQAMLDAGWTTGY